MDRFSRIVRLATTLGVSAAAPAALLSAQSIPELVRVASPAVVSIKMFDASGAETGLGSGFVLRDGRVVTNAHVVAGATRVEVFSADGRLLGTTPHAVAYSSSVDLAVLPAFGRIPGSV